MANCYCILHTSALSVYTLTAICVAKHKSVIILLPNKFEVTFHDTTTHVTFHLKTIPLQNVEVIGTEMF